MSTRSTTHSTVAVYPKLTAEFFSEVDIFDIYESIRNSYQSETLSICEKFADDILNVFKNSDKGKYQDSKRNTLQAVVFSGCYDRSKTAKKTANHSGRINFDIDQNTKEELSAFMSVIKEGKIPYIEAAALSVSGSLSGDFWLNIKAEIPSKLIGIDSYLVKKLNLTKENFKAELHSAFYEMFADMLSKEGIKAGKTKDLTRARYLSHDPDIYVNKDADRLKLNTLIGYFKQKETKHTEEKLESDSDDIIQSDAFLFAEQFAAKEFNLVDGQKHLYVNRLAICLNALGITQKEAEAYIQQKGIKVTSNCIEYPYKQYRNSFGQWKHKLKIEIPEHYSLTLSSGEKLSDIKEQMFDIIKKEHDTFSGSGSLLFDLSSGTGSGKSFFAANLLPTFLKNLNGLKTVIVFPLNSKTEKDSEQYNLPFVTGELLKRKKNKVWNNVLKSDVILTNINSFHLVAEKLNQKLNVIIDESHTLPNGMTSGYKPSEILKMWEAAKQYSNTLFLMSGTQKKYFNLIGFKKIDIKQTERPKINLTIIKKTEKTELAVLNFIKNFNLKDNQKLIIKIQSKNSIDRIYKLLTTDKKYNVDEVVRLYSCDKIKKSDAYKRIIKSNSTEESFADAVKIILCTSFVNEGLDIYSESELVSVSVLKYHTIDIDDEIQFFDRHRTNKEKSAFLIIPDPQQGQKIYKDYSLYLFKEGLSAAKKEADRLNSQTEIKSPLKPIFNTQTQYSSYEKTLVYSDTEQKIIVNEIQLMHLAEQRRKSSTGLKEALSEISERFKYIEIHQDQNVIFDNEDNEENKNLLDKIINKENQEKTKIQQTLQELTESNKEALIQFFAKHTEDVSIKKQAKKRLTPEERKKIILEVESDPMFNFLYKSMSDVINESNQAVKLIKRIFTLEKMYLSDPEIIQTLFKPNKEFISDSAYNILIEKFKILSHLYLFENCPDKLTKQQLCDAKRLSAAKNILNDHKNTKGEKMSSESIYKTLKPTFKKSLTERKAVRLTNILFYTERQSDKENNYEYYLKQERTLTEFLSDNNIDSKKILSNYE